MKRLLGAFCLLFVAVALYAQERTITGVVVDADLNNDPLPGATISVATAGSRVERSFYAESRLANKELYRSLFGLSNTNCEYHCRQV